MEKVMVNKKSVDLIEYYAEQYFQDSLAKFFPKEKKCPDVFKIMYKAGWLGWKNKVDEQKWFTKNNRKELQLPEATEEAVK